MAFQINKAERNQVKLRIALIAPSGGGKTYSALRLAKGMGGKVILIDTENKRSLIYADEFDFFHIPFDPPFTPERYIEAIEAAEAVEAATIIIDSTSHEWMGRGGILETHGKMPGNSWANWRTLTPRHEAFLDKLLRSSAHIIACLRGKDEYVTEEKDGKQTPRKIGVGPQMREGFEYECTLTLSLDQQTHVASAMKDNTHLFEGKYDTLTEAHGKALMEWANSGKACEVAPPVLTNQQRWLKLKTWARGAGIPDETIKTTASTAAGKPLASWGDAEFTNVEVALAELAAKQKEASA
jgi:hypothetical protein